MTFAALAVLHARAFSYPRPWSAAEIESLTASPGVFLIDGPRGFAMGRVVVDEAELLTLAVSPDARRQGIGRALMADYHARARQLGAVRAFLEVAADNVGAIGLYRSLGYAESGRRRGYYRDVPGGAVDALMMDRPLT